MGSARSPNDSLRVPGRICSAAPIFGNHPEPSSGEVTGTDNAASHRPPSAGRCWWRGCMGCWSRGKSSPAGVRPATSGATPQPPLGRDISCSYQRLANVLRLDYVTIKAYHKAQKWRNVSVNHGSLLTRLCRGSRVCAEPSLLGELFSSCGTIRPDRLELRNWIRASVTPCDR